MNMGERLLSGLADIEWGEGAFVFVVLIVLATWVARSRQLRKTREEVPDRTWRGAWVCISCESVSWIVKPGKAGCAQTSSVDEHIVCLLCGEFDSFVPCAAREKVKAYPAVEIRAPLGFPRRIEFIATRVVGMEFKFPPEPDIVEVTEAP